MSPRSFCLGSLRERAGHPPGLCAHLDVGPGCLEADDGACRRAAACSVVPSWHPGPTAKWAKVCAEAQTPKQKRAPWSGSARSIVFADRKRLYAAGDTLFLRRHANFLGITQTQGPPPATHHSYSTQHLRTQHSTQERNKTQQTCRHITQRYDLSRSPMWGWCGLDPTSPRICRRLGVGRKR